MWISNTKYGVKRLQYGRRSVRFLVKMKRSQSSDSSLMIGVSDVLKIRKSVEYVLCCDLHLSECKREHYLLRICEGAGRKILVTAIAAKGAKNTGLLVEVPT